MKNLLKRLTASLLTCVMFLGLLPAKEVSAASGDVMQVLSYDSEFENYDLAFKFGKFASSSGANYNLYGYRVRYWNITNGETEANATALPLEYHVSGTTDETITVRNVYLPAGCLYGFTLNAVYRNTSVTPTVYSETELDERFLFLSEIKVEAIGSDNIMNVKWNVPLIPTNQHFFTAYTIHYAEIVPALTVGGGLTSLAWDTAGQTIQASNVQYVQGTYVGGTRMATYNYGRDEFVPGNLFAIRVDPVLSDGTTALANEHKVVYTEGGKNYKLALNSNKYYKTDRAYIRPKVEVTYDDTAHVTVHWSPLSGFPVSEYISEIHIKKRYTNSYGTKVESLVTVVTGGTAATQSYYQVDRPPASETDATFFIEVYYNDITYADFKGPVQYVIRNMKVVSDEGEYDALAVAFTPYRPDIYQITDNRQAPFILDIIWKAFLREPYRDDEIATYGNKYLDKNVKYEIRITDDPQLFDSIPADMVYEHQGAGLTVEDIVVDGINTPHYKQTFDYYVTKTADGYEKKAFVTNKIYYVSIVGIRNDTGQSSQIAYGAHYIIPIAPIPIEPNMIAKPPLRIKVVDGVEEITENTITIEWDEQWIELFNPADGNWYSKAGVSGGTIVYGDSVSDEDNILVNLRSMSGNVLNEPVTKNAIKDAIVAAVPGSIPVLRMIDVRGANYKVHTAEYNALATSGYDNYYNDLIGDTTTQIWVDVTPTGSGTLELIVASSQNPEYAPLEGGKAYVIFLRPYMTGEEGDKLAYYPSYVTGTTIIGREIVPIKPVIPELEPVDVTDMSVTVRWQYLQPLTYELRFSDTMADHPEGGVLITWEEIQKNGKLVTDGGKLYMQYTIPNLFPETIYHIWIRSISEEYDLTSDWSNAIDMKTLEISPPPPPEGLGYASEQNVYYYNRDNSTNYRPFEDDYMIIEFLRIAADLYYTGEEGAGAGGGASATGGTAEYLENPEVNFTYMTMFSNLIPNRDYYVRAKTRLHFTKGENGTGIRSYSYILQVSLDPNFLDPIEIEVPGQADITVGLYKDSIWTTVGLVTGMTSDTYDGDKDPNTYPLPDTDFEITFDSKTDTLKWRFRSNQIGADGKKDNLVDERFITRLIKSGAFTYEVDLSLYNKNRIPKVRVIEMPVTIFNTFNERKIDLKIVADNLSVTFPYGSLMTPEVINMTGLDRNAKITLTVTHNPAGLTHAAGYLSEPHKVGAVLTGSNNQSVTIKNFAKPLEYSMKAAGTYTEVTTNIAGYVQDENTGGWQHLDSNWDTVKQTVNFKSPKAASFSALGILTPQAYQGTTLPQMYRANSKLSIMDLEVYDEDAAIHANQFNQIVAAALKGQNMVYMNQALSQDDYIALGKGKLLVAGNIVSREVGIAALVQLYEVKTQYPVTNHTTLLQTSYKDIAQADSQYQKALLKAADLGFYREATANPKGNMTMGDLMHILDIILLY